MRREGKKLAQVARIQARGQLTIPKPGGHNEPDAEYDKALAAFGLQEAGADADSDDDDLVTSDRARQSTPEPKCYLWPCNVLAWKCWQALQTQWLFTPKGHPSGLNYAGVAAYLATILRLKPKERTEIFSGLQAMEFASLEVWREQR